MNIAAIVTCGHMTFPNEVKVININNLEVFDMYEKRWTALHMTLVGRAIGQCHDSSRFAEHA